MLRAIWRICLVLCARGFLGSSFSSPIGRYTTPIRGSLARARIALGIFPRLTPHVSTSVRDQPLSSAASDEVYHRAIDAQRLSMIFCSLQ